MSVYQEKVQQVAGLLNEFDLDMWLIFVRETAEHTDPVLKVLGPLNAVWPAAFMFHRSGRASPSPAWATMRPCARTGCSTR